MSDIVESLGGKVLRSYSADVTHLVHAGTKQNESFKEFKRRPSHLEIVHPQWIEEVCKRLPRLAGGLTLTSRSSRSKPRSKRTKTTTHFSTTQRRAVNSPAWSPRLLTPHAKPRSAQNLAPRRPALHPGVPHKAYLLHLSGETPQSPDPPFQAPKWRPFPRRSR